MNIDQVITRLKEGNKRFVEDKLDGNLKDSATRIALAAGQHPYAIVLSCADSRVIPELVFDTGLGELFVIRVAGNIANTDSIASIEYALQNCGSKVIIVLGHQNCGAVTAAYQGDDVGYNLNHLLFHIMPAIKASGKGASIRAVIKTNAKMAATEIVNRSEIIRSYREEGKVRVFPAYYHLETGAVDFL